MKILQSALTGEKRLVSFRINLTESSAAEVELALEKASITYTKLDFPKGCYVLDENFSESDVWKLKIYKTWKIYVQSISSQIPVGFFNAHATTQSWILSLPEEKRAAEKQTLRILDACAAPGGKTSQLAEKYPNAEIFAFEPSKVRYEKMIHNFEKLWVQNIHTIHDSIENIWKYIESTSHNSFLNPYSLQEQGATNKINEYFDMILVDAPCSSEWSLSLHNTKFLENWDISHINKNYKRQKRICDSVVPYLKDGWELIYSTCTLAPEENEAVVHYLLCHYPELKLEKIELIENKYIKTKEALKSFGKHPYKKEISENCLRIIPSEYSEGFFIAKLLRKIIL